MTSSSQSQANPSVDSLAARVLALLRQKPDQIFLRHLNADLVAEELTVRDFYLQAMATSSLYDRFQVPVGGTVILVLSNPKDVFIAETAALLTGRIPIVSAHPSPKLSLNDFGRTLLPLIENAEPALIVGDPSYCSYLSAAIGRRVASLQDIETPGTLPQVVSSDNPIFFIQYSSGTTGTKKGVAISQKQLLWQVDAYAREIGLTPEDHIVSWLPYYHDMGLITSLMLPVLTGTPITVMSAFDWVKNPLMLMQAVTRYRGTLTWLPNFAYNFLAQAAQRGGVDGLDLSSLRGVVNCSEPVSAASHDIFLKTFAPCGFNAAALSACYAMAETTFAITSSGFTHPVRTDHIDRASLIAGTAVKSGPYEIVSSGRAISGTDIMIVGNDRKPLPDRHIGEIAVRSPSLMGGYFKNAEATLKAFADDFFLTGDLGYRDNGDLYVTGRIKDLIITAGRNIYPQDIESVVNDMPHTADGRCVAFGVADEGRGTEQIVILAELKPDSAISLRKAAQLISQAVTSRFDISLAEVMIVDSGWLKKSTSGKIARGQNRDRYLAQKAETAKPRTVDPTSPEDVIRGCIYSATGTWVEDIESPLITSGIVDSLALTNLLFLLEDAFKKALPGPEEAGFDSYDSIRAIASLVESGARGASTPILDLVVDRQVKANYVLEGPRDFDSLILGSSRSYLIRAKRATRHNLNAFQFAVAGARAEELACIVEFFLNTNRTPIKQIVWGADPIQFSPHLPIDIRMQRSPALFPLLAEGDRAGTMGLSLEEGGKESGFAKKMRVRYNAWDVDHAFDTKTGDVISLFGRRVDTIETLTYRDGDTAGKWPGQFLVAKDLTHLHPRRLYYLDKLMRLTEAAGCKLTIYTNPLHPSMIDRLKEQTPYLETQVLLVDYLRKTGHAGVSVHHFVTPSDFGGVDADYFDGVHMGRTNGARLLDYVLTKPPVQT